MKILYVTTISNTINAFLVPHIKMLINQGYSVDVACNVKRPIKKELIDLGVNVFQVDFNRSPITKDNYSAYKQIKKIMIKNNYELVHTHTPVASSLTRLACRKIDTNIFYTAHGFHFYTGAPLSNWLIYYPIEKYLSQYTHTLITINIEDYERAQKFRAKNVEYVPGVGLDIEEIRNIMVNKKDKRRELNIPENIFLIISVGELNSNKNHEVVIRALSQLKNDDIHYLICGNGTLEKYLEDLSMELGVANQVHLLGYRDDIIEILKIADVFAFPSEREGLPVSLMEAMASGLPVIASDIRGNSDLVDGKGGYLLPPEDIKKWNKMISDVYNLSVSEKENIGYYNKMKSKDYGLSNVLNDMKKIYKSSLIRN